MYKLKKNFLCAGIIEHFFSVILGHTSNVILGFIPRIHTKHSLVRHYRACPDNLDTRARLFVTPEDDNRMRMFFNPEDDKGMRLSNVILKHFSNVILGFIPRIHTKHSSSLDTRGKPEYDNRKNFIKGLDVVRQCATLLERCVQSGTRVRKAQAVTRQTNPIGRSMIEMLGVLAIIGVLSAGGMAGYSKALELLKINKQKQQLAELFNQCIIWKDSFMQECAQTRKRIQVIDSFEALGVIPDGMTNTGNNVLKDSLGNTIEALFWYNTWTDENNKSYSAYEYSLRFEIYQAEKSNRLKQKYCVTFLEQAKTIAPYLSSVQNFARNDSHYGFSSTYFDISKAKPHEISNFCQTCNSEKSCRLVMFFKI